MAGYIPNTTAQQDKMLKTLELDTVEMLFGNIPDDIRIKRALRLPKPLSELELKSHMRQLASKNINAADYACFLGAGIYDHYVPSAVKHIISKPEFYTAYTPYQPEISQGTLTAIFEYQTMLCELTSMDICNASMYDGATALAEAALMAVQASGRPEVLVSSSVNPEYRAVIATYAKYRGITVREIGLTNGQTDPGLLNEALNSECAALVLQNPNFFGIIENAYELIQAAHSRGALAIVSPDPISLGVLKSPGESGADISAGEGQSLGNGMNFGGPTLGFLTAKKELLRKMPGRIVGETVDKNGKRGYVLTIQTREQHIRREKATSNICSNQALNALAAAAYLTVMGKKGLKQAGELCVKKSHYAYDKLLSTGRLKPVFDAPFFKEAAFYSDIPVEELNQILLENRIIGGYSLENSYPELKKGYLLAFTEKRTKAEIDRLAEVISHA